jgi:hypothetical protein
MKRKWLLFYRYIVSINKFHIASINELHSLQLEAWEKEMTLNH